MSSNVNVPVNLTGLFVSLQNGEEFTAKQFVQSFINELKITVDQDFAFDSTGKIRNHKFWQQLKSLTVNELLTLKVDQMYRIANVVRKIFDIMVNKENIFKCWHQINRFFLDVQLKCTNEKFPLFGAIIVADLLNKFIEIPDFDQNDDIMESVTICLSSGSILADAVHQDVYTAVALRKKKKYSNEMFDECVHCVDRFYDLFAKHRVFFADIVFPLTLDFLKKSCICLDNVCLPKYMAVLSTLRPDRTDLMYKLCTEATPPNFLIKTVMKITTHRSEVMGILREMLIYSRTNNLLYPANWIKLFSFGMFSTEPEFIEASRQLFLLEAERKDNGEMADDNTLVEKAVRMFCQIANDSNVDDFILMFKEDIDFVACDKLFHLLSEHVSKERQKMAITVTVIIKGVAKMLATEQINRNRYVRLIRNILRHIELVRANPTILYRLINTIDLSVVKNDEEFREEMLLIEQPVLRAFYECDNYGTAIELLKILKSIDFIGDKLYKLVCDLTEKNVAAKMEDKRKMLELTLAAAETFDIFEKLNARDRLSVYSYFKKQFDASTNDINLNALYVTLIVYILKAYRSFPLSVSVLEVTREMQTIRDYINVHVLDKVNTSFSSMMFGIAFCVLNLDTAACSSVDARALHEIACKLADVSEGFPFAFHVIHRIEFYRANHLRNPQCDCKHFIVSCSRWLFDYAKLLWSTKTNYHEISGTDEDDDVKNFSFITSFWRSFNNLYRTRGLCVVSPYLLLEFYFYADVKLIAYVEEFILIAVGINVPGRYRRYGYFSGLVCDCVETIKPVANVMKLVRKLFRLIEKTTADTGFVASDIAMEIFGYNIGILRQNATRQKAIGDVQRYLFRVYFRTEDLRKAALDKLNFVIAGCTGAEKGRLQNLLNDLTKERMPPPRQVEPESDSDDSEQSHRSSNANSTVGGRRTGSLASVNQSMDLV